MNVAVISLAVAVVIILILGYLLYTATARCKSSLANCSAETQRYKRACVLSKINSPEMHGLIVQQTDAGGITYPTTNA
jgi:hypothetical protein